MDGGSRWDQIRDNRQDWVNNERGDLQNRLENRGDYLNDWQDNRQDFLDDRRDDWQDWADDRHPWHDDWHHGCWNNDFGDYWEHIWEEHPVWSAFAVTGWAWNATSYLFGVGTYYNPYWDTGYATTSVYDYSQPIVMYSEPVAETAVPAEAGTTTLPPGASPTALDTFAQARAVFQQGDYQQALGLTNETLKQLPSDAAVHEFRALCLFALGEYGQAAAALNPVLAVGPGWDWTTLMSLYPSTDVYTAQLRKLEEYVKAKLDAADARFVLAYHYLTMGHKDAAAKQLEYVVKAVPNDAVAKQMYDGLTYKPADNAPPQVPAEAVPSGPQIAAQDLVGTWNAAGPGSTKFALTLTGEGEFTWKYNRGQKEQTVKGAYAVDRNTLAMEPESGGVMLAELTPQGKDAFAFKTVGAKESDPPLKFAR